ncbi:MAG TPA: 3-dehydroquinate synthase [Gemmatimonadales bacterium]|nr:3-dehydroquinate synthase [Gemmatimonadales bacterium]
MTTIPVALSEKPHASYDVIVGRGVGERLPALLRERCPAHVYAVVTDSRVAALYGERTLALLEAAGLTARLFPFPAGEWNKVRETWADLCDRMIAGGIGRDAAVVALGGGVAGDLGGFVAATLYRGIPYAQVPTTVLAMVDASVGGKTGVDLPAGKNLVGAFHAPRFVLADIDTLGTLPRNQIAAGCAEAIKHGVVADAAYADDVGSGATACLARVLDALGPLVERSIRIKGAVVAADEREHGRRQILNFGHTVAHAVEARSGYALLHGEAVAIGMVVEATLAETLGVARAGTHRRVLDLVERFELPCRVPDSVATEDLLEAMRVDKKVRAGAVRFALPSAIGEMAHSADGAWTVEVNPTDIRAALDACR